MKLTQAEIDALFAEYARNPDALEKIGQNPEAASPESGAKAPAENPPASDARAAGSDQVKQGTAAAPAAAGKPEEKDESPSEAAQATAPASFPSLQPGPVVPKDNPTLGVLANVELDVSVSLGHTRKSIREILSLGPGSVLELDTQAGEAVDIEVNGRVVARGEVVVVGENYGVRITELVSPAGGPTG